jgi:hypothetical protein
MTNAIHTARESIASRRRDPLFPVGLAAAALGAVHLVHRFL